MKLKRKKLRTRKALDNKKIVLIVVLVLFISVGFSVLTTSLGMTAYVTIKKKVWDATEVSYTTSYNSSVTNSKQAIDDLHSKIFKEPYTYTKTGKNGFTGTYTCVNGIATISECSYYGGLGNDTCSSQVDGVSDTYMCTLDSTVSDSMYDYCSTNLNDDDAGNYGGGLPKTEYCL